MLKQSKAGGGGVLPANHMPRGEKTLKVVLCHQLLPLCLASCSLPWGPAVTMGWLCLGFLDLLWFCGRFLFLASPVFFFCTCLMWAERERRGKKKKRLCKQHKPSQKLLSGCGLSAPGQLSLLPCLLEESSSHQKCCFGLCDQTQTHVHLLRLHHPQQGSQVTQCCPCCQESGRDAVPRDPGRPCLVGVMPNPSF